MSFDRDLRAKEKAKYDDRFREMEAEAALWLNEVLTPAELLPEHDLCGTLRDGVVLCELCNVLVPNSVRYKRSPMPFKQMENIAAFLAFCASHLAIPQQDLFQTIDLYERRNAFQVVQAIHTVSRYAVQAGLWHGRFLGPRMATSQSREFTKEQLLEAKNHVNTYQYGKFSGSTNVVRGMRRDPAGHFH